MEQFVEEEYQYFLSKQTERVQSQYNIIEKKNYCKWRKICKIKTKNDERNSVEKRIS